MPHQNRVTPFGKLIATPERGTLNGNRGRLHDDKGVITRLFREKRWIICLLEFKGRRHPIMKPGLYTDLFFLDEATALAAGHRPCAECQRDRFNVFRERWMQGRPEKVENGMVLAPVMDEILHSERMGMRKTCVSLDAIPSGTFLTDNGLDAYLVLDKKMLRWTPAGYEAVTEDQIKFPSTILTPASIVEALIAGYPINIHPSAFVA